METGKKVTIGGMILSVLAVGIRLGMIYNERHAAVAPVERVSTWTVKDDDLVFLKKTHPSSLKDVKDLAGKPLWVSAGGQMDIYPYTGHRVDYGHEAGLLLGADRIEIKDAVEASAPKAATFRIPGGDKQVLFVFTKPGSDAEYAVPVGYREKEQYTFFVDEIFFYEDPHMLYKRWSADTWKAIDEHRATLGMNERQAMLSLGQVSSSGSTDYGNRTVVYDHQGHPVTMTFEKDKATGDPLMAFGLEAVDDHLQAYFPDAEQFILQEQKLKGPGHIDVHVVMPTETRPYFVLVTSGMSNRAMNVPAEFAGSARAECFLCLPGDWPLSMINRGWREPEFAWPIFLLQEIARFPFEHETWLGYGHSVPIPHALDPAGRFSGISLLQPLLMQEDFIAIEAGDDEVIWLLPVLPCTPPEMEFKRARGYAALSERFSAAGVSELLDPVRPSVAPMQ